MSDWYLNDDSVDAHYARNYYGAGTDYFRPGEHWDENLQEWVEDEDEED